MFVGSTTGVLSGVVPLLCTFRSIGGVEVNAIDWNCVIGGDVDVDVVCVGGGLSNCPGSRRPPSGFRLGWTLCPICTGRVPFSWVTGLSTLVVIAASVG